MSADCSIRWSALLLALVWMAPGYADASASFILSTLRPGEWYELPNTKLSAVFPKEAETTWGVVGPESVVRAWSGAAYDTKRNLFVLNGGGHADYGGNEVYAFALEDLKWTRLTEPSRMRELPSGQFVTTDETPVSAHTYGSLAYLPNVDRIFRNGGAEWRSGKNFDRSAWLFDVARRRWQRGAAGGGGLAVSVYDPVKATVYVIGSARVDEYDPVHDTWTARVTGQADFRPDIGALDPLARKLVTNSYRPGVIVYDIAKDGSLTGRRFAETQGATEWDRKMLALEYDPVRKVLVAWAGDRGTAYLDVKAMLWQRYSNTASANGPVKSRDRDYLASGAIFGRWRYVPKYDVFIGYNNPRGNVWVWKPALAGEGDTAAPARPLAPLLQDLKSGETVVLPPGIYEEAIAISASNVVIKADGVRLQDTALEGKAAIVVKGNNVTIEGLECTGIRVDDGNGACVRLEGKNLTLRRVRFQDSQSGVLSWNRDCGTVLIEDSRFERMGRAHGIYIGRGPTHLIVRRSSFLRSVNEGHEIKSRAARNTIENNVIASLDGVDSRLIDLPEGGENIIRRNVLEEGPISSNQDLIGIALEGQRSLHSRNSTLIEENLIIMERRGANVLLNERYVPAARVERNTVIGGMPAGGTNVWYRDRASAGLAQYPALPNAPN